MLSYNDLYEILRKEKYSEPLQPLQKEFLNEFADYLRSKKDEGITEGDLFVEGVAKSKKQLENSIAIFKELLLRRKRKLLNLVFVAAETGIMKRDYENMLPVEREMFEKLVKAFEEGDKEIAKAIHGGGEQATNNLRMVIFTQDVEQLVDTSGNVLGPFTAGELANLDSEISKIFVSSGKATIVDDA